MSHPQTPPCHWSCRTCADEMPEPPMAAILELMEHLGIEREFKLSEQLARGSFQLGWEAAQGHHHGYVDDRWRSG